jgi:hypothetical protein
VFGRCSRNYGQNSISGGPPSNTGRVLDEHSILLLVDARLSGHDLVREMRRSSPAPPASSGAISSRHSYARARPCERSSVTTLGTTTAGWRRISRERPANAYFFACVGRNRACPSQYGSLPQPVRRARAQAGIGRQRQAQLVGKTKPTSRSFEPRSWRTSWPIGCAPLLTLTAPRAQNAASAYDHGAKSFTSRCGSPSRELIRLRFESEPRTVLTHRRPDSRNDGGQADSRGDLLLLV